MKPYAYSPSDIAECRESKIAERTATLLMQKISGKHALIEPTEHHISQMRDWFPDPEALRTWGGPGLEFDVSLSSFIEQLNMEKVASFSLLNSKDEIAGFGQFYQRLNRCHFGRLVISPEFRGQGLILELLRQLHDKATEIQQTKGFSLFVLETNEAAKRNYQKCGFNKAEYPGGIPGGMSDCIYMVADRLNF